MSITSAFNALCRLSFKGEYCRFMSVSDIRQTQLCYLLRLLGKNAGTVYGRRFDFADIRSYDDFAKSVPLTRYEDYQDYIGEIADGAPDILTTEKVLLLEPTSGSSGGRKLIPYTPSLKAEFQRGIKPWLYDIYSRVKGVTAGKSYWSITPVTGGKSYTSSGIPIGFDEDAAYFGRVSRFLMDKVFAVDESVKFSESTEQFYLDTAQRLLSCGELSLISVWNPTFLSILCSYIGKAFELCKDRLDKERAKEIFGGLSRDRFDKVFPGLRIISCWADGSAKADAAKLRGLFPDVYIQPKGLLATEYFASFPLVGEEGSRLCVTSHFFEFRGSDGIVTADKLTPGEYELIVTTGGGLYRYMTGDVAEVIGTYPDAPPRIRFLRRSGVTCDLCGEKLTDDFVRSVCEKLGIAERFCLLAPEGKGYVLYTDADVNGDALDDALRDSFHYDYCRRLGQLGCARVVKVCEGAHERYLQRLTQEGMRLGDIKPAFLSSKSGWEKWLLNSR